MFNNWRSSFCVVHVPPCRPTTSTQNRFVFKSGGKACSRTHSRPESFDGCAMPRSALTNDLLWQGHATSQRNQVLAQWRLNVGTTLPALCQHSATTVGDTHSLACSAIQSVAETPVLSLALVSYRYYRSTLLLSWPSCITKMNATSRLYMHIYAQRWNSYWRKQWSFWPL